MEQLVLSPYVSSKTLFIIRFTLLLLLLVNFVIDITLVQDVLALKWLFYLTNWTFFLWIQYSALAWTASYYYMTDSQSFMTWSKNAKVFRWLMGTWLYPTLSVLQFVVPLAFWANYKNNLFPNQPALANYFSVFKHGVLTLFYLVEMTLTTMPMGNWVEYCHALGTVLLYIGWMFLGSRLFEQDGVPWFPYNVLDPVNSNAWIYYLFIIFGTLVAFVALSWLHSWKNTLKSQNRISLPV